MTALGSISGVMAPDIGESSCPGNNTSSELASRSVMTRRSALWAAYGDALGWISELTDSKGLTRRTGGNPLRRPIEWRRRIGGRGGITATLPQGCYSDDSQLRLATGRAIRPSCFDVEAFAKVELPVWLSYGLGGGKSTSAAATNLSKKKVTWFANTFTGWSNSGGNGAAMRIQPHVWATPDLNDATSYLPDVVCNTICTHSHPIGLLGSVIHAKTLAQTMATGCHPNFSDLMEAVETAVGLPEIMQKNEEVGNYWRGVFERESGSFRDAWARAIEECVEAVAVAGQSCSNSNGAGRYAAMIERLKLRDPARRGSGMLTAIASVGLLCCEAEPEKAMCIAANELGTDTDTIASMAGAIAGAVAESEPEIPVLDAELFCSEADRLVKVAFGKRPVSHQYPDLLHWSAPIGRADTLARTRDGRLYVRGLGPAKKVKDPITSPKGDFKWQWLELESGQTILIKRRADLKLIEDEDETRPAQPSLLPQTPPRVATIQPPSVVDRGSTDSSSSAEKALKEGKNATSEQEPSLDLQGALRYVQERKDDDKAVGAALRRVVKNGTTGQIATFTSVLIDELRKTEMTR